MDNVLAFAIETMPHIEAARRLCNRMTSVKKILPGRFFTAAGTERDTPRLLSWQGKRCARYQQQCATLRHYLKTFQQAHLPAFENHWIEL